MDRLKQNWKGWQLVLLKLVSLTVFQISFLWSVTFDIMLGRHICWFLKIHSKYYIDIIIWLSLFPPCDWSICSPAQNFKENAHFGALNLFTSEKMLKLSYKTSINLEDLNFDFVLQHFKLCLFVNEGDEETNS